MAERMPLAYPNTGTSQINFSLPLRLARKQSRSILFVHPSTESPLKEPSMRPRVTSAPADLAYALAYALAPLSVHSDLAPSPTLLDQDNSSNLRPRPVSYSSVNRRAPPRLQLRPSIQTRHRAGSGSTTTSSLEASLAELQELIEVLSTPVPLDAGFFDAQAETEVGAEIEYSKTA